eukprot:TRINITY_DN7769_c0_g1_i2.p1 TRINITY_DN7769_c0_g1~~TRINITY_DN7769_c0_g1_i2.p1  ORF type:complete len:285 (+),score=37.67 TRINITY_DN7769_c0_g1_i2:159-1013(+)
MAATMVTSSAPLPMESGSCGSSAKFEVQKHPDRGRYIVAKMDLPPGETVVRSSAYALAVCENFKMRVCSRCFRKNLDYDRIEWPSCVICGEVCFCFDCCKKEAGGVINHDEIECEALRKLREINGRRRFFVEDLCEIRLVINILARRYHEKNNSNNKENTDINNVGYVSELVTSEKLTFASLDPLVSNREKRHAEELRTIREQAECILRVMGASAADLEVTTVIDIICKIKCNSFGIWSKRSRWIATGVFPVASLFNHSCLWYEFHRMRPLNRRANKVLFFHYQ